MKVTLGTRPTSFKQTVRVVLHDAEEGEIVVSFRYRTRKEYGQLIDTLADRGRATVTVAGEGDDARAMEVFVRTRTALQVEHLMEIMDGWNLDQPFDRAHVQQLNEELPGLAQAIIDRYQQASMEGRLGN